MAVKYNVIEKKLPGQHNNGKVQYFAVAKSDGRVGLSEMTEYVESISTVSGADIRAVLYAVEEFIVKSLSDSKIVELGELGNFMIRINSQGKDNSEEVNNKCIIKSKAVFVPGKRFHKSLSNVKYLKNE